MADAKTARWREALAEEERYRKGAKTPLGKAFATTEGYRPAVRGDKEAQNKVYDKMQNMREEEVEYRAKEAGIEGDPYDSRTTRKGYAAGGPAKGQMPMQLPKPASRAAEKEEDYMPSPEKRKEMEDMIREQRMRRAGDTAPTTRTEMGKRFAAGGGVTRGDGCVSKGHTKGRMI